MGDLQVMDSDHNKDLYSILLIKVCLTVYLLFIISIYNKVCNLILFKRHNALPMGCAVCEAMCYCIET